MHIESVSGFPTDPWLESETSKVPPASRLVRVNWIRIAPPGPPSRNGKSGKRRTSGVSAPVETACAQYCHVAFYLESMDVQYLRILAYYCSPEFQASGLRAGLRLIDLIASIPL